MNRIEAGSVHPMTRGFLIAATVLAATAWAAAPAFAQEAPPETGAEAGAEAAPAGAVIRTAPDQPRSLESWLQQDLKDAEQRSRRTRNALIGTSAAFAVGAVLVGAGASQCQTDPLNTNEWTCNTAGNVLVGIGGTITGLSFVGMLTSGIMLGVANKRKREAERELRRSYYSKRLRWDIPSGRFVF